MILVRPPFSKAKIPAILFEKIHKIQEQALKAPKEKQGVLKHLTNLSEAYSYVYYTYLVDALLKKEKGLIVDWGGFCGQVTVLLNSLGYECENYVLEYPSQKHLFEEFGIKYKLHNDPKRLPYKTDSCLAVISSGVLEHVHEERMTEEEALKEIFRILKPGGHFFCWNLPKKYALIEFIARYFHTSCHPKRYILTEIKNSLNKSGFKIMYSDQHGDILKIGRFRVLLNKFSPWTGLVLDYYFSKIPFINLFSHHITIVGQKPRANKV